MKNKLIVGAILVLFTIFLGGCGFDMVKDNNITTAQQCKITKYLYV